MRETATGRPARRRWESSPIDPADPTSIRDLPQAEIYTVRQAAVALGISAGLVYELLRDGRIPGKRLGRRWVIPRARFHAWPNDRPESA
jgi:excisionase family DNA binding protein